MRYKFPHYTPVPQFVQPDYSQWNDVTKGMSRDEVIDLLGLPLNDYFRGGKWKYSHTHYCYGYLQMPMLPHPRTYNFLIYFDNGGKVRNKEDPFNHKLSMDGAPTIPEIIIPQNNITFSHYPRIIDIRWYPSSGVYPMNYIVEMGNQYMIDPETPGQFQDEVIEDNLSVPFYMDTFCGAQPGRIRIKAKNKMGESDWSGYCNFRFTR